MAVRAVLALVVALGPRTVDAAPVARASIEVDAAAVGDDADALARAVADEGQVVLRDADVLPARTESDATIHVELSPGYRYVAWADRSGEEIDGTRKSGECASCSEHELAQAVAEAITAMVEPLRAASDSTPTPAIEPDPTPDPTPQPVDRGRIKIGGLGIGGIVLIAVGVGSIGGGAAMLARGKDVAPDPADPSRLEGRDFRPGGGALMAVGVAAVITGAVMLFVGIQKGKEARNRKTALTPRLGGLAVAF